MKTIQLLSIAVLLLTTTLSTAQSQYSTNAETATELEGIITADDALSVRYFYYPNLQAYFDRETSTYLYSRNGKDWIESSKLPTALRGYSIANNKRVAISDYSGDEPYALVEEHMKKFPANYSGKRQPKNDQEKPAEAVAMQ